MLWTGFLGANIKLLRLRSGAILCAYRDEDPQRRGVSVSISDDGGEQWRFAGQLYAADAAVPHKPLTPRQQEVLEWLLKGLTNAKIAQKLGISAETVKLHVSAILQAFNVTTRIDLVLAYANDPARRESA